MLQKIFKLVQEFLKPKFITLLPKDFAYEFKKDSQAVLIDVRTKTEFQMGHIWQAKNLDVNSVQFTVEISQFIPSKKYFVYCRSGTRSRMAAVLMSIKGLSIVNLRGGYESIKDLI